MMLWLAINSAAIALLAVVLFLTIRQIGVLMSQVGIVGARQAETARGPRVGENISFYTRRFLAAESPGRPLLILFGADGCPACSRIAEGVGTLHRQWEPRADFLVVYDGERRTAVDELMQDLGIPFARGTVLREQLRVDLLPYGIVTDPDGVVRAHGLVNSTSQVESLLEAIEAYTQHSSPRPAQAAPAQLEVTTA